MGMLKYKGYSGSVEYSDEDKCLFGKVQGLHGTLISYEGITIAEITNDFHAAVDDYLASCTQRGIEPAKPYSGKLVLRMSSELHGQVAAAAFAAGTTINDFINKAVSNEVARITR
ncbi:MAG: type II toxin-antitoxin system HicB family antitoxin [Muribaculaceae bacterium]